MLLSWRHVPSPLARIQLSHVTTYASRHYVTTEIAVCVFSFFTALFSWITNKNLQQDHCSSIAMHRRWQQLLLKRLQDVSCIVCFGRSIHYKDWITQWKYWTRLGSQKSQIRSVLLYTVPGYLFVGFDILHFITELLIVFHANSAYHEVFLKCSLS